MNLIDGKATALAIQNELRQQIALLPGRPPRLDVILVGQFAPSIIYVTNKTKACAQIGIASTIHKLPEDTTEEQLLNTIESLNNDQTVDGILIQLPLPAHINTQKIMSAIDPCKDVDGFHPVNRGKLMLGDPEALIPCTPLGIIELLKRYNIATTGQRVTIVGRSNIVGKPLAVLLLQPSEQGNATVTVAHSLTRNLEEVCASADILIAAVGKAHIIGPRMVKEGAVVIDVGMNALEETEKNAKRRVVGDVDFHAVKHKCRLITPVPGGVGPMTIAMLLANTLKAYKMHVS